MNDEPLLGPWVRRFLLEHLVAERNLARNTQRSYRDALTLLIPFAADQLRQPVDRLQVVDVSADLVRLFLADLEQTRQCAITTRNQRLAAVHALARFVGEHSPEHIAWCGQIRSVPFKKASKTVIPYLDTTKRISPHTIRHTTATHLLRAGVDINTVRAWLGHVSLDTTNIYAEIDLETKAKALAKCEIGDPPKPKPRWREDPGLMAFLRSL
jgi:site-specific recombinase XerD